jgi:polyhydroxybutyrate depolymerase
MKRILVAASILALAAACSSSKETNGTTSTGTSSTGTTSTAAGGAGGAGGAPVIGGDRPVDVYAPDGLAPGQKVPLVLLLHGYSVSGAVEELYMQLLPLVQKKGFVYAHPTGTIDSSKNYFWNATDACCNFDGSTVDDSAYLASVIDEIIAAYPVDPKRVYLIGHSNGGFMSYRMACDHADKIAAIASLAGAMWLDTTKCQPSQPVHVLQIHGTADQEVIYTGDTGLGSGMDGYPGAETTVQDWAKIDGCSLTPDTSAPPLDLDEALAGAETTVERYAAGCKSGGSAELWSIQGGSHIPAIGDTFRNDVIDFLFAHAKP